MPTRPRAFLLVVVLTLLLAGSVFGGPTIGYVGLRVSLPIGGLPPFFGIELGGQVSFGYAFVSLLLSPDGKSLLLGSADFSLAEALGWTAGVVRLSAGLSYQVGDALPGLAGGGGIVLGLFAEEGGLRVGVSGELLYPIAVGPPFISLEGGWAMW